MLRSEPLLTLVAFLDLARHRVDVHLHRTGGQRVTESVGDRAALGVLLHDLPRVAVVAIHADVELVDERVLKHHALKVVDRREHHVVGLRQVARVTHRSLLLGLRHQLGVGVGRILPAHRVDERQGGDRILEAPEDFHRITVLEEALHAQQRGKELLRDEVHPRHRAAFEAQLLAVHGHLEERRDDVADDRDVVHEDRVHVAEVVRDVARIIEVRRSLEAGDPPATTVLLVLTGQAEAADHQAEGEQAGEADARLHEGVRHVDRFEHLAHVVHLLARGGGVVTGDRVDCLGQAGHQRTLLPAVQRGGDERVHALQAEHAGCGVEAVVREHELQPQQCAGDRHCHPRARGERIERPLPEQAGCGGLHALHIGDRVESHLVQRLQVPLDPGGIVHQFESDRLRRGIGQPLHRADVHQHGLDVAASHLVRAHAVVGILDLAGEGRDLGEPSLDLARRLRNRVHLERVVDHALELRVLSEHLVQPAELLPLFLRVRRERSRGRLAAQHIRHVLQRVLHLRLKRSADHQQRVEQRIERADVRGRAEDGRTLVAVVDEAHAVLDHIHLGVAHRRAAVGVALAPRLCPADLGVRCFADCGVHEPRHLLDLRLREQSLAMRGVGEQGVRVVERSGARLRAGDRSTREQEVRIHVRVQERIRSGQEHRIEELVLGVANRGRDVQPVAPIGGE